MKFIELTLGLVGLVLFAAILIPMVVMVAVGWSILWVAGSPVRVTDEGGKTLGHYRWFTFYRSSDASS